MLFAMDPCRKVTASFGLEMIRRFHIRVRLDCDPFYEAEAVKKAFSGADSLEVEIFRSSWGMGGYDALEGYTNVRGVRKARVHGSVGAGFAEWLEWVMQAPEGRIIGEFEHYEHIEGVSKPKMLWNQDRLC